MSVHTLAHVILMSVHAGVDSAVEAITLGAREYLTRPFDVDRRREPAARRRSR